MTERLARASSVGLFAALSLVTHVSLAAPCGRPDVDDTFPPNGSDSVPTNADLAAHYAAPADYVDEEVLVAGPQGDVPVEIVYDEAESMLRALPLIDLVPGPHVVTWPGLRGVATNRGLGLTAEFTVGTEPDVEMPRFSGLSSIDWDLSRELDECTDTYEDRFWFDLGIGSASDDMNPSLLAIVVFQTRSANGKQSAPEQVAVRPLPDNRSVRVERPAMGEGKVCFAAVTRDLVHNVSGGGDKQVCVETIEPPFFDGCSLSASTNPSNVKFASGRGRSALAALFALSLVVLARRRGAHRA
jgi:hypothetical protein